MFCQPYNNVLEVLRPKYRHAIHKIGKWSEKRHRLADPNECLLNHLLAFYWRGIIELDDLLLEEVYQRAPVELRSHAVNHLGRILLEADDVIEGEVLERFRLFWEWRFDEVQKASASAEDAKELVYFGNWFVSKRYDDEWLIPQLYEVLKLTSWAEMDHLVVRRLAEVSQLYPDLAVRCLAKMVEGDKEGWGVIGWKEHIRTVLESAISQPNPDIRQAGIDLANRLGSLGHLEYRDLVSPASG